MTTDLWVPAFIGLGSNLDNPPSQLRAAVAALQSLSLSHAFQISKIYRSAPLGPPDQPHYLNAVVALLTRLSPTDLLHELLAIEKDLGRIRDGVRWGARRIDLDLLLYGDRVVTEPGLEVPHPAMLTRVFVLAPLADLAPERRLFDGRTVRQHLADLDLGQLELQGELGTL